MRKEVVAWSKEVMKDKFKIFKDRVGHLQGKEVFRLMT